MNIKPTIAKDAGTALWKVTFEGRPEAGGTFKTRTAARDHAAAVKAGLVEPTVEPEPTVDPATLDRVELLKQAKAETAALKAWKDAGSEGDAPATPCRDYLAQNDAATRRAAKKGSGKGGERKPALDPDVEAKVLDIIRTMRAAGQGGELIARHLNDQGIPAARGGVWYSNAVRLLANKHGIVTTRGSLKAQSTEGRAA